MLICVSFQQPALLQATNPAVTLAQYQQLLQQHGYASPHTHPQPGSAAATALVPSSCTAATSVSAVSSSPSNVNNNNTHLVDPNSMGGLVMTSAGGVINGVNLSSPAHMCSSDSPPLNGKAFTVEVRKSITFKNTFSYSKFLKKFKKQGKTPRVLEQSPDCSKYPLAGLE